MDNNNSVDMSNFMNNLNGMLENENVKNLLHNIKNNASSNSDNSSNTENNNSANINPEMLNNLMNMFNNSNNNAHSNNSNNNSSNDTSNAPNIDMDMLLKMKAIMEKMNGNKNDPRSNLLLSLKPYLKESRKNKVEQYIQLFNMSKVMEVLNPNGGEKSK